MLGGGTWDKKACRTLVRDRLGEWGAVLEKGGAGKGIGATLAIKPHRSGAMNRPEHALWLLNQLKRPAWLRLVYDYSHFDLRDLPLEGTVKALAADTVFVAVKDVALRDEAAFLLPAESKRVSITSASSPCWPGPAIAGTSTAR